MLSGSGIKVFVLRNVGLWWDGWGNVQVNDRGGWGCGRDGVWRGTGVVVCVVYWRCVKGAVVRLMSCNAPLKASRLLWVNTLAVPLGYCSYSDLLDPSNDSCLQDMKHRATSVGAGGGLSKNLNGRQRQCDVSLSNHSHQCTHILTINKSIETNNIKC